jgi:hypothetical protein
MTVRTSKQKSRPSFYLTFPPEVEKWLRGTAKKQGFRSIPDFIRHIVREQWQVNRNGAHQAQAVTTSDNAS